MSPRVSAVPCSAAPRLKVTAARSGVDLTPIWRATGRTDASRGAAESAAASADPRPPPPADYNEEEAAVEALLSRVSDGVLGEDRREALAGLRDLLVDNPQVR